MAEDKTTKRKSNAGRKPKFIDQVEFEKLCALQCTLPEFECFFNCDGDTLNAWCKRVYGLKFSEVFAIKRGFGKVSLRRSQFQMAQTNPTMAIWLGKQYLDQHEDPKRYERVETTEDKIDRFLDALTDNLVNNPTISDKDDHEEDAATDDGAESGAEEGA